MTNNFLPRPVLYQKNTLWIFLIVGIVFIPVGVLLIVFYDGTKEKVVDYTDCFTPDKSTNCRDFVQNIDNQKAGESNGFNGGAWRSG